MKHAVVAAALLWLTACKDRGTITAVFTQPCTQRDAEKVRVYLVRGEKCERFTGCGLQFDCTAEDCVAACELGCTPEELGELTLEPRQPGMYALVLTYLYPELGAFVERGMTCYDLEVDADGTTSTSATPAESTCCLPDAMP